MTISSLRHNTARDGHTAVMNHTSARGVATNQVPAALATNLPESCTAAKAVHLPTRFALPYDGHNARSIVSGSVDRSELAGEAAVA